MPKVYNTKDEIGFHTASGNQTLEYLNAGMDGIDEKEAKKRGDIYGKNRLEEGEHKNVFQMFIEQFKNIMVIVLIVAALISGIMGELTDTVIILVVVIINAFLGVIQESKAEKALLALKSMSAPYAKVKRGGKVKRLNTEELVPGDIVLLEAGDYVPADMRLLDCASLKIEESALTGESVPVEKIVEAIEGEDIVIGDRRNMAYSGSSVTYGRGTGVVTATAMSTEVGKIARHLKGDPQETPLQRKLSEMSKFLTLAIIIVSVIVFAAGVLQGRDYFEMFLTAVSLAVAAIPEGLPAVITIVLAIGVQKMSKRNAIIRKLSAVETLGCTEIICSDKTGTLTQNKMTVKEIYADGRNIDASDVEEGDHKLSAFMQILTLCNDSRATGAESETRSFIGDPTETALVYFSSEKGFDKERLERDLPRSAEIPFDSDRKLMTTVNQTGEGLRVMTKGAPDILLGRCGKILLNGSIEPITEEISQSIKQANHDMAKKALRVLAVAFKDVDGIPQDMDSENVERELVFAGLVGMIDPPRPEAREAVKVCKTAGIRPVMITGDHRDTAAAIARELDIIKDESEVITGSELGKISDEDFETAVERYSVYARVSPEHKVRIVNTWKKKGKIVAMTGDGVNDAPALKAADIGVGMGITGTDVSKGVSNMVLADDNFATIVFAVEEGRKIYSNIRKAIQFLLSSNLGEVFTLFVATMLNWTILMPIHILWVNLVTDTLPALALGVEKAESDVMTQKPRKANSSFFSDGLGVSVIYQGIAKGAITLLAYYIGSELYSHEAAMTMSFATLGLIQLTHSLNVRSNTKSLLKLGLFTNRYLIGAIILSGLMQIMVIIITPLNAIFKVTHLNLQQWAIVAAAAVAIIPIVELAKLIHNKREKYK
ncbi:Ca2+-transporting ATPase [Anaerobacterium chartisolvens]|uniref:P-type Ca(2+) transporter n=1 Tax=Anaerobacterium chartisolvens TaxID=1297424 RepID=A0A369BF97_9FIRM|nr:calcium-translocating P-type ATPase, SERCA-type [Anaerobacterium chartisolvens]RCX19288.1 Ca2+-transporting ATPase [Anaerobacterium chartisolvens]